MVDNDFLASCLFHEKHGGSNAALSILLSLIKVGIKEILTKQDTLSAIIEFECDPKARLSVF